ncbi:MAG: tripartite tricarboxylate transporter substrate binding protein [Acetobacteraceae bacterium]|nr:tripartite tricarboxylate transporter substrate binding protein [Acetobacteraceae bacterium]
MQRRAMLAGLAAATAPFMAARAQSWPTRPIRLIIPYPPGGATDTLARPFAERMRARLGQPLVIENRGGAATSIGMEAAARAAPDGYTLVVNADNVAYFPLLYRRLPYDLFRDFVAVSNLAATPLVLGINPRVPARDLHEFVALLRREPDRWAFANPSLGAPHHLGFELFAREAGVRMLQVEYRGGGPALNDVLAGHVHLGVFSLGAVSQHFQAGTLRPLAILSPRRSGAAPDIPTTAEMGLPRVLSDLNFMLFAPSAVPRDIVTALHAAVAESMADPALRETLGRAGFDISTSTPEEAAARLRAERERWAPVLTGLNLNLE